MINFDAELIKDEDGRKQLAQEIATALDNDMSDPFPTKEDWVGENTLSNFISEVIEPRQLFSQFATVCKIAYDIATVASVRVVLLLGQIRCWCCLPWAMRDDEEVRDAFENVWTNIHCLASVSRKTRLIALCTNHAGTFFHLVGDYVSAAEAYKLSARYACKDGDLCSEAIYLFCVAVADVNQALSQGWSCILNNRRLLQRDLLKDLREAGSSLQRTMSVKLDKNERTAVLWSLFHIPHELLIAHFLAGEMCVDSRGNFDRLRKFRDLHPELYKAYKYEIAISSAIHQYYGAPELFRRGSARSLVTDVMEKKFVSAPSPECLAIAYLIRAKNVFSDARDSVAGLGSIEPATKKDEAKQYLRTAINVKDPVVRRVRDVARRELRRMLNKVG